MAADEPATALGARALVGHVAGAAFHSNCVCWSAAERTLRPFETSEPEPEENIPPPPTAAGEAATASTAAPDNPVRWEDFLDGAEPGSDAPPWHGAAAAGIVAPTVTGPVLVMPNPGFVQVPFALAGRVAPAEQVDEVAGSHHEAPDALVARLTYDDLSALTGGLSRDRINAGLKKLIEQKMIWRVDRSSSYGLTGFGKGSSG